ARRHEAIATDRHLRHGERAVGGSGGPCHRVSRCVEYKSGGGTCDGNVCTRHERAIRVAVQIGSATHRARAIVDVYDLAAIRTGEGDTCEHYRNESAHPNPTS